MYCIPSFTMFSIIIGILVSMSNIIRMGMPFNLKWFKTSTIAMLASLIILGNSMILFHEEELIGYYSKCMNLNEKKIKNLLHFNNILAHIIVPIILIQIISNQYNKAKGESSWWKSFFTTMGSAGLYTVISKLKFATSYGLNNETKIRYGIAYIILTSIINSIKYFQ